MQVIQAPNEMLRVKPRPVKKINPALLSTLKEMIKLTKTFKDPEGVGLASTQVGLNGRFFVVLWDDGKKSKVKNFKIIINPKILNFSKKTKVFMEGCLSIPNIWGEIKRPVSITAEYQDETEKNIKEKLTGLKAHVFQHEMDHLNGILFTMRVIEQKTKLYKVVGKDKTGADIFEEITL